MVAVVNLYDDGIKLKFMSLLLSGKVRKICGGGSTPHKPATSHVNMVRA